MDGCHQIQLPFLLADGETAEWICPLPSSLPVHVSETMDIDPEQPLPVAPSLLDLMIYPFAPGRVAPDKHDHA